jgi:putative membrane protein
MISYDPKLWFRDLFSLHGTIIARVMGRVFLFGFMTFALWLYDFVVVRYELARPVPPLDPVGHQVIGVAIGLIIVLRTNASFDRWWEGRKLWGSLVNETRNLVRSAAAFAGPADDLAILVAAYVNAVKHHLRGERDLSAIKDQLPADVFAKVSVAANPPTMLAYYLGDWVRQRLTEGRIDSIIARHLDSHVTLLVDYQGGCERIVRTPIPFAYAVHIKQLLLIYLASLPFLLVPKMDWIAIVVVMIISFGMLGIEEAGIEIEDPFGEDPNDLPLNDLCAVIARDTAALAELARK